MPECQFADNYAILDLAPIVLEGGKMKAVEEFPYLESFVESSQRMDVDVNRRGAQASKIFGAFSKAVFLDKDLSWSRHRGVQCMCPLSPLVWSAGSHSDNMENG